MSFWGSLTGQDAADTSRKAAADTYTKQIAAGQQANEGYQNIAQGYNPFINTGVMGNNQLQQLLQNPDYVQNLPGYKFAQEQGERGLFANAAARGLGQSGKAVKDFTRFNQGLASQQYGNEFNRLQGLAQFGLGATGAKSGVLGQGLNTQFQSAYGGAPTIGQGDVAAEQAKMTGLQGLLGAGTYLGGSLLGGAKFKNPFGGGQAAKPWTNPDQPWFNS